MKKNIIVLSIVFLGLTSFGKEKYPQTLTEKFKSGKTKTTSVLTGYNNYESSETFYENAQLKISYKRKVATKDPYGSDIYTYKEYTDKGLILADGECAIRTTENFMPQQSCYNFSGVEFLYDPETQLPISETHLSKGKLHGLSKLIDKTEIVETTYNQGVKVKKVIKDKKTDKVLKSEEYYEDGSIKK